MKKTRVIKEPLISFCLTTFGRPDLLQKTLKDILAQTYTNYEVIVCDNDPKGGSRSAVTALKSPKLHYHVNKKNLGMVPSFNRAFTLSKGDFIVFMADDDPPYPQMLEVLVKLYHQNPDCTSYFGAFDSYNPEDKVLADKIQMKVGYTSGRNLKWPLGFEKVFQSAEYLKLALQGDIFYYLMWSTGIVKREVVEKLGKDPVREYGSALMTDRCYALEVGAAGPTMIINQELGIQTVHQRSFSLNESDSRMLIDGFVGYYRQMEPIIKQFHLEAQQQEFVFRHVFNMFIIMSISNNLAHRKTDVEHFMNVYDEIAVSIPFLKKRRWELELILKHRFPFEIIFKAAHMPPEKVARTGIYFLKERFNWSLN